MAAPSMPLSSTTIRAEFLKQEGVAARTRPILGPCLDNVAISHSISSEVRSFQSSQALRRDQGDSTCGTEPHHSH